MKKLESFVLCLKFLCLVLHFSSYFLFSSLLFNLLFSFPLFLLSFLTFCSGFFSEDPLSSFLLSLGAKSTSSSLKDISLFNYGGKFKKEDEKEEEKEEGEKGEKERGKYPQVEKLYVSFEGAKKGETLPPLFLPDALFPKLKSFRIDGFFFNFLFFFPFLFFFSFFSLLLFYSSFSFSSFIEINIHKIKQEFVMKMISFDFSLKIPHWKNSIFLRPHF